MIERNINGIVDYCISKVEELDQLEDVSIEKRAKLGLAYLKEARNYTLANLQHKKLLITAPDVAKNADIVLPIGTQMKFARPTRTEDLNEIREA